MDFRQWVIHWWDFRVGWKGPSVVNRIGGYRLLGFSIEFNYDDHVGD